MSGKKLSLPDHAGDTFAEIRPALRKPAGRAVEEEGAGDFDNFEGLANASKVRPQHELEFEGDDYGDDYGEEGGEEDWGDDGGLGGDVEPRPDEFGMDVDIMQSAAKIRQEKMQLLSRLSDLASRGAPVPADVSMRTNVGELRHHVETIERSINLRASLRNQKQMLMTFVGGLEFVNKHYNDYMEIHLDGWSNQVYSQINDYDPVMERLYDRYMKTLEFHPLLELFAMLSYSAVSFHLSHLIVKSVAPDVNAALQADPALMNQLMKSMIKQMDNKNATPGTLPAPAAAAPAAPTKPRMNPPPLAGLFGGGGLGAPVMGISDQIGNGILASKNGRPLASEATKVSLPGRQTQVEIAQGHAKETPFPPPPPPPEPQWEPPAVELAMPPTEVLVDLPEDAVHESDIIRVPIEDTSSRRSSRAKKK